MARYDAETVVVGGGVVGCAVARRLAAGGIDTVLLEAQNALGTEASATNSGILHTGFDSEPGELETELILSSARLRERELPGLGVPVERCGALLRGAGAEQTGTVARLAENARRNSVAVELRAPGELLIPGESITDPVAFTAALGEQARSVGAELRLSTPVAALAPEPGGGVRIELAGGGQLRAKGLANCAGLHADELAGAGGERAFEIHPRKGEFLVYEQPSEPLRRILLPVPSAAGKGVLVFPTIDGHVIAGPTARNREDKRDWSVEPDAAELIHSRVREALPALESMQPIAAYAGLRPAGRGVNYVIAPSGSLPGAVDVAAIRSTGLSASLGIAEHVYGLLLDVVGLRPREAVELPALAKRTPGRPWWRFAAERSAGATR